MIHNTPPPTSAEDAGMPYNTETCLEDEEETDTFDNGTGCNNLSLSAQLASLQKLLSAASLGPRNPRPRRYSRERVFPIELPRPPRLKYLLGVYFREMDSFFPFLSQADTEARISCTLKALDYSELDLMIDVDVRHHSIIALLCNILVLGECLDPEVKGCNDLRPGWRMYNRGRKLLQHCGSPRIVDMDLVRYHTLSALYMMNSEQLQSAAQAISTAAQLAMVARLNDQSRWAESDADEQLYQQRLWWTIYTLDRRIAQRHGTPYLIRDSEVAVKDFDTQLAEQQPDLSRSQPVAEDQRIIPIIHTNRYMQVLVSLGRLWGYIWDTLYAASAPKRGDWKEVAYVSAQSPNRNDANRRIDRLTDTRILIIRREVPPTLTWETDKASAYVTNGETEPHIRRRLSIFLVGAIYVAFLIHLAN